MIKLFVEVNICLDENNTNWFYTTKNVYCSIISDQPIYVAQIGVSTRYASGNFGDYGYGYSTPFNGTNTIAHPNPNGKLFVSVYGWTPNAGYS